MSGKIIAGGIVALALLVGAAVYYLQVYYYYDTVELEPEALVVSLADGGTETVAVGDLRAIDAISSPIRFRACFSTDAAPEALSARALPYPDAAPLTAPHWFDCFDAAEIGAALEDGRMRAFLGTRNVVHGVDRVFAIGPDGRGFAWHQVNEEIKE